jgi:Tfp pilus assembly protein PilF
MQKILIIASLLTILCFTAVYGQDKEIAFQYYTQAKQLFDQGSLDKAKELILKSIEFYPDFSDALYVLAKIYEKNQETTLLSLTCYQKALKTNSWVSVLVFTAQRDLANLYLRIKRYTESLAALNSIKDEYNADAQSELIRAEALQGLNRLKEAVAVYKKALNIYPNALKLYLSYLNFLIKNRSINEARAFIEKGRAEFKDNPDFLYYKILIEQDTTKKLDLINNYIDLGGTKADITLPAFKVKTDKHKYYLDFFIKNGGLLHIDYLDQLLGLVKNDKELDQYLKNQIGELNGEKIIDENNDGYYEEKYIYKDGRLEKWILDKNQDGISELSIDFINQNPAIAKIFTKDQQEVHYYYNLYPYLKKVFYYKQKNVICYDVIPSAKSLPVLVPQNTSSLRLNNNKNLSYPDEKTIIKFSFSCSEYTADSLILLRKWELNNGEKVKLFEDTDGNGKMDHIVIFNKNLPVSGMQDLDGNGIYEIVEEYEQGKLKSLQYDDNDDGKSDYIQFNTSGERKMWDLNGDGQFDVIEYKDKQGRIIRQYSTRLNGVFDLTIFSQ